MRPEFVLYHKRSPYDLPSLWSWVFGYWRSTGWYRGRVRNQQGFRFFGVERVSFGPVLNLTTESVHIYDLVDRIHQELAHISTWTHITDAQLAGLKTHLETALNLPPQS